MSRRRKRKEPEAAPAGVKELLEASAAGAMALALTKAAFLIDPLAEASFDAPKRLATLILVAAATVAAFLLGGGGVRLGEIWRHAGRLPRTALVLFTFALSGAVAAALLSPRKETSLDALRLLLIFSLLIPLGASRVLQTYGRLLLGLFLALSSLNAAVSLLQWKGIFRPFALETVGARETTGAFAGNVGYLALTLSLAAVAALAAALETRNAAARAACGAAILLFLADLVVNQNLTSVTAMAAGGATLAIVRGGRRALLPIAAVVAALLLGVWAFRPARARVGEAANALRARDWDRLLTYRFGPWSAAAEMARERPLLGFGPGTFAAEFVPHRLKAEISARRRYVNPLVTSSYSEAHSEPLQALAEGGLAGLAAIGAAAALLSALWRTARRGVSSEAGLLLAVLVAGSVAALTWFPLQRPISAIPLLLAAGRGWRISAETAGGEKT